MKQKEDYGRWLFHKLFFFEIFRKVRVAEITGQPLFQDRNPPKPLTLENTLLHDKEPQVHSLFDVLFNSQLAISRW